ncbi:hypothetical protein VaNZ11_012527 [Volvox africanus]|uniref:Ankyrin repeat domain-containing protein n=1 Tax=Volvox africanus TaxID=51714 RepID=A0ABQ5SFF1_9CHLO|nr:hypothetical protein VaNZ11_012527 [Volvox africanus]
MDSDEDNFFDAEDEFDEACDDDLKLSTLKYRSSHTKSLLGSGSATRGDGASTSNEPRSCTPVAEVHEPFPLHRAAWYGQVELVKRLAEGMGKEQLKAYDAQGNTALHVAVMRRQSDVVSALLDAGCSAVARNARGWVPLMEAVELGDRTLALQLAAAESAQVRTVVKAKKATLLALLRKEMPDFSLQLKWELGSSMPGVGALVRRYAPHDTYTLWKKGGFIRVDGSLMGIDVENANVVPTWKRGHFSLLYNATGEKARAIIVNHADKTFLDVKGASKRLGALESEINPVEAEVNELMAAEVLQRKKLRSVDFRFKPVSGWLTKEVREKVEGWNCKLFEAAGRLVSVSHYKMPYGLTPNTSFDEYLASTFDADPIVESPVNPMSVKDRGVNSSKAAAKLAVAAKHQRIAAAAAAAKDEEAARIATAAAVRAAAGGLRALGREDKGEGGKADCQDDRADGAVGKERVSRHVRKRAGTAARTGGLPPRTAPVVAAGESGICGETDVAAQVVASAELPPPPDAAAGGAASAATAEEEEQEEKDGDEDGRKDDLAELDLTALAARVAAEAERAKPGEGRDDDDADFDVGDGNNFGNGEEEGTSLEKGTVDDEEGNLERGTRTGGGKRDVAFTVDSNSSFPAATAAVANSSKCGKNASCGAGSGAFGRRRSSSGGRQTNSANSWRSWTFGKKGPESGGSSSGGGGADTAITGGAAAAKGAVSKKSRKFTGRCWMAESFPLSLKQLLPLLEVVGTANKAFSKVARFMQKYGDLDMFPVKVQVPLILTVYMLLSFKQFRLLGNGPDCMAAPHDEFFQVPPGYTEENLEKAQSRFVSKGSATEEARTTTAGVALSRQEVETAAVTPSSISNNSAVDGRTDSDGSA